MALHPCDCVSTRQTQQTYKVKIVELYKRPRILFLSLSQSVWLSHFIPLSLSLSIPFYPNPSLSLCVSCCTLLSLSYYPSLAINLSLSLCLSLSLSIFKVNKSFKRRNRSLFKNVTLRRTIRLV
jgi:hypothetical protein